MSTPAEIRRLIPQMRRALVVSVVVLAALGTTLVLFPEQTDRYFSWPIEPPLTASVLAANYYAATLVLLLALRGWVWAPAQVVLPGGIAFSALATLATFMHLSRFNFSSDAVSAKVFAWVWLVAYLILPPLLVAFWPSQARAPGRDPAPDPPPRWLQIAVLAIGAVLVAVGVVLFLAPDTAAERWPWPLTPLTSRVLSAWLLGLGLVFAVAAWSRDRLRLRAPVAGLLAFGILQGLALLRHGADAGGGALGAWIVVLVACGAVGAAGLPAVWSAHPAGGKAG